MPISGWILLCPTVAHDSVRRALSEVSGVEVGVANERGIAVVVETAEGELGETLAERFRRLPGVRDAVLVCYYSEDLPRAVAGGGPATAQRRIDQHEAWREL